MEYYFYIICDPRIANDKIYSDIFGQTYSINYEPFYVGKGCKLRYKQKKNSDVERRISEIKSCGLNPHYTIIKFENEESAFENEYNLTKIFGLKMLNEGPLLNRKYGGTGGKTNQIPWNKGLKTNQIPWNKGLKMKKINTDKETSSNIKSNTDRRSKKLYEIIFPDGHIEHISNLKQFCSKYKINYRNLHAMSIHKNNRNHVNNFKAIKLI